VNPVSISLLFLKQLQKKNKDIVFGMVDIEKDPEIGEYFQIDKIPGLLVVREKAGNSCANWRNWRTST
jgi:hypothetical protein